MASYDILGRGGGTLAAEHDTSIMHKPISKAFQSAQALGRLAAAHIDLDSVGTCLVINAYSWTGAEQDQQKWRVRMTYITSYSVNVKVRQQCP